MQQDGLSNCRGRREINMKQSALSFAIAALQNWLKLICEYLQRGARLNFKYPPSKYAHFTIVHHSS